ncbi:MAG: MFS transporter [Candidatus Lokiarchaeota archaeon]|nr:MFS transporter [Candidatus Lokiarchaeota archaeon]
MPISYRSMPLTNIKKKDILPIVLILVLLFISVACQSMLIPSYAIMGAEFGVTAEWFAIPDAFFVLISAGFAIFWGYFADKVDRIKVLMAGAFSWTFGMFFTFFSGNYTTLVWSRALSGAGLGCVLPIGYSIISDAIPPDERSGWFGTIAIVSGISNASGQALSSFLGPITSWRFPFLLLSIVSCIVIFLMIFVKMPKRGETEGELIELTHYNLEYSYKISKDDFVAITKKKTNRNLVLQGFFTLVPGTVLTFFLTTLLREYYFFDIPDKIRLQTATIFAGLIAAGYILGNLIFSALGDYLFKKNKVNRARLGFVCLVLVIPFALLLFFSITVVDSSKLGINYPAQISNEEVGKYMLETIIAIFTVYPSYYVTFSFALIASVLTAGPAANKNAVMADVNLPEHRGTAASMINLSEQMSKGLTLLFSSWLIGFLGGMFNMMVFSILFWIPAGLFWYRASKRVSDEMDAKSKILSERGQITLIDHIFELEIEMDKATQKVQDSKYYITLNEKKFFSLLEEALKSFKFCASEGGSRSITNIEKKANGMIHRVEQVRNEAKKIYKDLNKEKLSDEEIQKQKDLLEHIGEKISVWGKSTFGELQMYYEDAYIKIVEAKLLRKRDLINSMGKINEAIIIYHRVKHLLKERVEDVEKIKLAKEEHKMFEKEHSLYEKSKNALNATVRLKEGIEKVIIQLSEKGIQKEDLMKISDLTLEYQVNLYKVMEDTFGKDNKTKKSIQEVLKKIDQIFEQYDQWKESDLKVF